ncbi:uncharacterized protein C19orf47 homolog [Culicoides brevitarsis]|uniref:uncharacterized protein C19orf47 homolog n=1 Tax=Culicoides brevitarsis TaxID=469753 RepID=UPI00307B5E00
MTSLDKWTDFFRKAGLPKEVANTYAHSFTENRIQMTMLPDLNKEYLREMGIFRMGDIILILRQAKSVQEHGDLVSPSSRVKRKVSEDSEDEKPVIKRNSSVMSGKMRSDIKPIVRKSVMTEESDEEPSPVRRKVEKQPQRAMLVLKESDNGRALPQRTISTAKPTIKRTVDTKNSIFDRLGGKTAEPVVIKPSLKSSPLSASSPQLKNQRVLMVKKVPAKASYASSNELTDDEDEYLNHSTEKSVSFSKQDEIIEISSQKKGILKRRQKSPQNVKARLGLKNASQALAKMRLQQSPARGAAAVAKVVSSLESDKILRQQQKKNQSVHERLFSVKQQQKKEISLSSGRKVKLNNTPLKNGSNGGLKKQNSGQSVFDRLGFNKR